MLTARHEWRPFIKDLWASGSKPKTLRLELTGKSGVWLCVIFRSVSKISTYSLVKLLILYFSAFVFVCLIFISVFLDFEKNGILLYNNKFLTYHNKNILNRAIGASLPLNMKIEINLVYFNGFVQCFGYNLILFWIEVFDDDHKI